MKILFIALSCILGLVCIGLAWLVGCKVKSSGGQCLGYPRRPVWPGMILGAVCLVWSAYHGCGMLEGDLEKFRVVAWSLVPVTLVLSYFFLDYINARVLGGLFVLFANHLIGGAFVYDVPCRSVYGVLCLILGVLGLVGIGLPWRYRDILELSQKNARIRVGLSAFFCLCALALIVMPFTARL